MKYNYLLLATFLFLGFTWVKIHAVENLPTAQETQLVDVASTNTFRENNIATTTSHFPTNIVENEEPIALISAGIGGFESDGPSYLSAISSDGSRTICSSIIVRQTR